MTNAVNPSITSRVDKLKHRAGRDWKGAQDAVWEWLQRLGADLPAHAAEVQLAELFAAGTPADIDGPTDGILLGWTADQGLDRAGRALRSAAKLLTMRLGIVPWLGKTFDRRARRGSNSVTRAAVVLCRLLAPNYRLRKAGDHWEGFDMLNRTELSVIQPGTQVLVLDYETIGTNPWPINRVRDEAVEIVPGIYLGAKLWHQADGYKLLAYWAAKSS